MKYLASICEQKKMFCAQNLSTVLALFTAQVQKENEKKNQQKQRTSNLFPPYQWKTNSLHDIVKFGVKIDLFSDISLFYRINAFIVFVQIWIFLFIHIHPLIKLSLVLFTEFQRLSKMCSPWVILGHFLLKSAKNRSFLRSRLPILQQSSPWLL